jgi:hypothetical protein
MLKFLVLFAAYQKVPPGFEPAETPLQHDDAHDRTTADNHPITDYLGGTCAHR